MAIVPYIGVYTTIYVAPMGRNLAPSLRGQKSLIFDWGSDVKSMRHSLRLGIRRATSLREGGKDGFAVGGNCKAKHQFILPTGMNNIFEGYGEKFLKK